MNQIDLVMKVEVVIDLEVEKFMCLHYPIGSKWLNVPADTEYEIIGHKRTVWWFNTSRQTIKIRVEITPRMVQRRTLLHHETHRTSSEHRDSDRDLDQQKLSTSSHGHREV